MTDTLNKLKFIILHFLFGCPDKNIVYRLSRTEQTIECNACGKVHKRQTV